MRPLVKLRQAGCDYVHEGDLRVPMFFSEPVTGQDLRNMTWFTCGVAALLSSVQVFPSLFLKVHHSSYGDHLIWQICLIFINAQPLGFLRILNENMSVGRFAPRYVQILQLFAIIVVLSVYNLPADPYYSFLPFNSQFTRTCS